MAELFGATKKQIVAGCCDVLVVNSLFDYIIDNGIATDSEVRLVVDINGYSEETMKDIIFARTGNRSYEQCVADGFSRDSYLDSYYGLD